MDETAQPGATEHNAMVVGALRERVDGQVLGPDDTGYHDARVLYNAMIDLRPLAVVRVADHSDVSAVLRCARELGLSISVRGGGHGIAGHAMAGHLVIDMSALRAVKVDAHACTAVVQAGATWREVDLATQAYELAVPGGRISHAGVAGVTLGGGDGWLSARHGLTVDNLLAVEMVTADGRLTGAATAR